MSEPCSLQVAFGILPRSLRNHATCPVRQQGSNRLAVRESLRAEARAGTQTNGIDTMKTSHRTVILILSLLGNLFHGEPTLAAGCPNPSFITAGTFAAGANPSSVTTGDFNGDGK